LELELEQLAEVVEVAVVKLLVVVVVPDAEVEAASSYGAYQ
jgi:hypothetical protein